MSIGAQTYKECSSTKNEGVDDVFEAATRASLLIGTAQPSGGRRAGDAGDVASGCRCVVS